MFSCSFQLFVCVCVCRRITIRERAEVATVSVRTLSSAFRAENLRDLLQGVDEDSQEEILTKHFQFAIRTLKQFCEFGILFGAFPWRFCLLQEEQYCNQVLQEMKREWELLLRLEESHPNASTTWPLNQVHQVRWYVYREVMTFAEERSWAMCPEILALSRAWDSDPCSTLSVENSFRSLRRGEKNQDGPASAPQLQAISIRSVNERFQKFEVIQPSPSDIHTVPVSPNHEGRSVGLQTLHWTRDRPWQLQWHGENHGSESSFPDTSLTQPVGGDEAN